MQRIGKGTNKNVLPIFGNRKRHRQAMFADSIDFANNANDDSLFVDDDMLADKSQNTVDNFSGIINCQNNQGKRSTQSSYQNTQSRPSTQQKSYQFNRRNKNTNQFSNRDNPEGNNYLQNTLSNNYSQMNFTNDPMHSSTQNNNTLNYQQSNQSCYFPNESFNMQSQMRPLDKNNVNMASTPRNTSQMRNQTSKTNFPSQNSSDQKNRNPNSFLNQTQPVRNMAISTSYQSNSSRSFSNQSLNGDNKNRNSFNYTNQKKPSSRNSSEFNPTLGTLPPPTKSMKSSFNNRNQQQSKSTRNNNQQHQVTHTDISDKTYQFSNHQPTANNHINRSSVSSNNNQADAVVPQNKFESKSPVSWIVKKQNMTTKFVTSTIGGLEKWRPVLEKTLVMFELCGHLSSPIPHNPQTSEKVFTISDGTGELRCVFWEIDRQLPQLSRGSTVRCIGKLHHGYLHCLSVRNIKPRETQLMKKLIEKSNKCLLKEMAELRDN